MEGQTGEEAEGRGQMAAVCLRSGRPCGAGLLQLHREAQRQREVVRRRSGEGKENTPPPHLLQTTNRSQRTGRTQSSTSRTQHRECGWRFGEEVRSRRAEIRVALIRKTRMRSHPTTGEAAVGGSGSEDAARQRAAGPAPDPPGMRSARTGSQRIRTPRCRSRSKGRRKVRASTLGDRGQLRLSLAAEAERLLVHVHSARGLMGKTQRSCDSFVQLLVTSERSASNRTKTMKTHIVHSNNNPQYDRRFVLCVSDELHWRRLIVSVFRRRSDSRSSQLIGCMSFGLRSLMSAPKPVSGWFYLLGEELGRSKHLKAARRQSGGGRRREEAPELRRTPDPPPDSDLDPDLNRGTSAPSGFSMATLSRPAAPSTSATPPDALQPQEPQQQPQDHNSVNDNKQHRTTLMVSPDDGHLEAVMHTIHRLCRDCIGQNLPQVSIARGDQGFGFTICSDCPPRVQALDPGGPAQRSGLRQGDSVLQLNGLPVETWKCSDLAHAIRSCPSQIVLVVWRGLPEVRASCDSWLRPSAPSRTTTTTTTRKLLPVPATSKHGRRWAQGSMVRSGLGALGALWKDRGEDHKQEEEEEEVPDSPPRTATLKGTRVTSSNGDNYIILSPVDPGGQVLQPLYQDATIGRLYQTRGARGQGLLQDPQSTSSAQAFTLAPPPPAAPHPSGPPTDYSNYQNCTLVQSHLPSYADYGAFVTPAPKTLIFPIFVQPLDLCSPDRTLLMLEEMFVHQAQLPPAKVTVLIYSDLLLLTREDEAGRCNVLQSPVYLNTLQLQEVPSEPLLIQLLQSAGGSCWRLLFTLEALSMEQKLRVSLCLHDNSQHHLVAMETACSQHRLVAMETGCSQQLSHLPSDFGLLTLSQSDIVYHSSSPYSSLAPPPARTASSPPVASLPRRAASPPPSLLSPVWKERGRMEEERRWEEEEERQQGEGESASETSESVGGAGGRGLPPLLHQLLVHEEDDEEGDDLNSAHRAAALRRSLSEGSLLREPRSPRFLSDSTIHRLIRPAAAAAAAAAAFDPCPASAHTLKSQLTAESDSLQQVLLLLNGTKDAQLGDLGLKRNKNLAEDIRNRLPFLRRRKNSYHSNSLEKAPRNKRASVVEVLSWARSLETLLANPNGRAVFRNFLRSEFSEENLDFWLAVERFKRTHSQVKMAARAAKIYREFISATAVRQVNVDSAVRESTDEGLRRGIGPTSFQLAQDQIFSLMESDSYPRFLKSRLYAQLAEGRATPAAAAAPPLCSVGLP